MGSFSWALTKIKQGQRVTRTGWNGKSMWLRLVTDRQWAMVEESSTLHPGVEILPWIGMKTANDKFVPWLASQTDMLAEDWMVVE